jgi:hypothetical protein
MFVVLNVKIFHEQFAEQIAVDHDVSRCLIEDALYFMRARIHECPGIGSTCRTIGTCQSNIANIIWQQWE